jgi:sugar/nucleoside kinase (ribokinase family)
MPEICNAQALDLVLVGAISKDENIYPDSNERSIGGAVTYGAFSAKRSGSRVGVITKLAQEDHHLVDQFCDEQIPVWVLPSKKTTAIRNVYHSSDKERRTCTCLAATDAFSPENLPTLSTKIIHAAALIKGEIPLETVQSMTRIAEVGLDLQGFLRVSRNRKMVFEKSDEVELALSVLFKGGCK